MADSDVEEYLHPEKNIPKACFGHIRSIHAVAKHVRGQTNRHNAPKTVATTAMTVGSTGLSVATTATGTGAAAMATGAAAVTATGVGAVVVGGALTLGSMGLAMRSAYKTNKHIDNLLTILAMRPQYAGRCAQFARDTGGGGGGDEHKIIEQVLIYVINKKRSKLFKKGATATGVGAPLVTIHRGGKAIYKKLRGTKGKNRTNAAKWLGKHLITTHCPMAQEIVAELLDEQTMQFLMRQSLNDVTSVIARKMKSI